ncbi:MAG: hypothetical protein IKQ20_03335 [Bacteroidales bacterium]|nr:hypothetical protein [Bacteroidales bacterium]
MSDKIVEMVDEPKVVFKLMSDRDVFKVTNEELGQTLVEISGYDLQINFNMDFIKSMEDVEAAIDGMSQIWRKIIMARLLSLQNEQKE